MFSADQYQALQEKLDCLASLLEQITDYDVQVMELIDEVYAS